MNLRMTALKARPENPQTPDVEDRIESVAISTVKPWGNNPRKNDDAAKKLADIIKVRGQVTPIVVWRKNGVVYKGNTTLKAMKMLGHKTIKVLYADFPSEQAAVAYGIADNKSSEWAGWDYDLLAGLMQAEEVSAQGMTGFSDKEIMAFSSHKGFASDNYSEAAEQFEQAVGLCKGKKTGKVPFWFWFEVPDEETFQAIKEQYTNAAEKRLHRELDYKKLKEVL
jgi:hypothetical protein